MESWNCATSPGPQGSVSAARCVSRYSVAPECSRPVTRATRSLRAFQWAWASLWTRKSPACRKLNTQTCLVTTARTHLGCRRPLVYGRGVRSSSAFPAKHWPFSPKKPSACWVSVLFFWCSCTGAGVGVVLTTASYKSRKLISGTIKKTWKVSVSSSPSSSQVVDFLSFFLPRAPLCEPFLSPKSKSQSGGRLLRRRNR